MTEYGVHVVTKVLPATMRCCAQAGVYVRDEERTQEVACLQQLLAKYGTVW